MKKIDIYIEIENDSKYSYFKGNGRTNNRWFNAQGDDPTPCCFDLPQGQFSPNGDPGCPPGAPQSPNQLFSYGNTDYVTLPYCDTGIPEEEDDGPDVVPFEEINPNQSQLPAGCDYILDQFGGNESAMQNWVQSNMGDMCTVANDPTDPNYLNAYDAILANGWDPFYCECGGYDPVSPADPSLVPSDEQEEIVEETPLCRICEDGMGYSAGQIVDLGGACDQYSGNFGFPQMVFEDEECDSLGTGGCLTPNAINYDPTADYNDGSCIMPVSGCTNTQATNYNPNANVDNGSCVLPECPCIYSDMNQSQVIDNQQGGMGEVEDDNKFSGFNRGRAIGRGRGRGFGQVRGYSGECRTSADCVAGRPSDCNPCQSSCVGGVCEYEQMSQLSTNTRKNGWY